jgi:hypothetical protein
VPARQWALAGDVLGDVTAWQRAVHTNPTCREAWRKLCEARGLAAAAP